jgi:hypothetical protein
MLANWLLNARQLVIKCSPIRYQMLASSLPIHRLKLANSSPLARQLVIKC